MNDKKNITIGDVAEALGISKSTVSRSISGKGRVGEATRNQVLKYIEEHNYVPNALARGLASQRTYNVGLIMPEDFAGEELPFFQKCLMGICETAHEHDYNVLISMSGSDNGHLERIIDNRKIDGVLLARTLSDDSKVRLLKEREMPFVTIGSYSDDEVIQVDNDNEKACYELSRELINLGIKSIALISGVESYVVTQSRKAGFMSAAKETSDMKAGIFYDGSDLNRTVEDIVNASYECIVCMDDSICLRVLEILKNKNLSVPGDMKVASFYGSKLLDKNSPPITSVLFDSRELGKKACRTLLDVIEECEVSKKTLMDYKLQITDSIG